MSPRSAVRFDHLEAMTDERGLFEHCDGRLVRTEHGYCTDDNARLLSLTLAEAADAPQRLGRVALDFVLAAQASDGRFHNRMDLSGRFTDRASTDDCWGRALGALGTAATIHPDDATRQRCLAAFELGCRHRSTWSRPMAFASLGAAAVVSADPGNRTARRLLTDALLVIGAPSSGTWAWPEPTLRYGNATLAEATIVAGHAVGDSLALERGLAMLTWLLELETNDGHLSVVGSHGRGPSDRGPQFDQQPIEVAAMADACWRAGTVTGDRSWDAGVERAAAWFDGSNDLGLVMWDEESGGGFDGLQADRVNRNQGAESTMALWSTMQRRHAAESVG